jgi:predicted phage terminase large subunit-like protein
MSSSVQTRTKAQKKRRLIFKTVTEPQRQFHASEARFKALIGGVGAGKTRAGCVEVLRMPPGSTGMVVAPTFPMLRDATATTLLDLARRGGVLKDWNRSEMTATLVDGKRVLFRSADTPDRLRGPNLGWAYLDEAALMDAETWLIVIGRLRNAPGKAWVTSTPKGKNWLYETFAQGGGGEYALVQSSSRDNPFLPPGFVETLQRAYTSDWQQQEIEGAFIDPSGAMFARQWFRIVDSVPGGVASSDVWGTMPAGPGNPAPSRLRWVRYWDLAASVKTSSDYTASAAVALDATGDGTMYIRDMIRGRWEWPDAKKVITQTMLAEPDVTHAIEEALHGIAAVQELRREPALSHVTLRGVHVDKDKVSRALPWAARAEAGKVALVRGEWIGAFLDEVCGFPNAPHDDMVDTISGALPLLSSEVTVRWL